MAPSATLTSQLLFSSTPWEWHVLRAAMVTAGAVCIMRGAVGTQGAKRAMLSTMVVVTAVLVSCGLLSVHWSPGTVFLFFNDWQHPDFLQEDDILERESIKWAKLVFALYVTLRCLSAGLNRLRLTSIALLSLILPLITVGAIRCAWDAHAWIPEITVLDSGGAGAVHTLLGSAALVLAAFCGRHHAELVRQDGYSAVGGLLHVLGMVLPLLPENDGMLAVSNGFLAVGFGAFAGYLVRLVLTKVQGEDMKPWWKPKCKEMYGCGMAGLISSLPLLRSPIYLPIPISFLCGPLFILSKFVIEDKIGVCDPLSIAATHLLPGFVGVIVGIINPQIEAMRTSPREFPSRLGLHVFAALAFAAWGAAFPALICGLLKCCKALAYTEEEQKHGVGIWMVKGPDDVEANRSRLNHSNVFPMVRAIDNQYEDSEDDLDNLPPPPSNLLAPPKPSNNNTTFKIGGNDMTIGSLAGPIMASTQKELKLPRLVTKEEQTGIEYLPQGAARSPPRVPQMGFTPHGRSPPLAVTAPRAPDYNSSEAQHKPATGQFAPSEAQHMLATALRSSEPRARTRSTQSTDLDDLPPRRSIVLVTDDDEDDYGSVYDMDVDTPMRRRKKGNVNIPDELKK